MSEKRIILERLREKAEKLLDSSAFKTNQPEALEAQALLHELQLHHFELEMQNDEMIIVSAELERQRAQFSNLFQLAPLGYLVLDNMTVIKDINDTGANIFGTRKESLFGKPLNGFIHPEDSNTFSNFFRSLIASKRHHSCQIKMFRSNREIYYARLNGICVNNNYRELSCYLTLADITEEILAELKLKEAKRRLEMALSASLTGTWEIDMHSGSLLLDNFGCKIFGFKQTADFDGDFSTLLKLLEYQQSAKVEMAIRRAIVAKKELNIDFSFTDLNGNYKYVNARGQILDDKQLETARFTGVITDITEKKQMELEAARLKDSQLLAITAATLSAQENEKKRVSETLHDSVGQMLYAIKLNLQQYKDNPSKDYLEHVNELLNQTIKDVRNISFELAPSILKDFGISATLDELAKRLSTPMLSVCTKVTNINNNLDINVALNIYRIVQELVNNSIKHAEASQINIEVNKRGHHFYIEVTDNGKGIKMSKTSYLSSGTGLSSIRNRLNLYNGTMDISNKDGKGTRVYIKLKQ